MKLLMAMELMAMSVYEFECSGSVVYMFIGEIFLNYLTKMKNWN